MYFISLLTERQISSLEITSPSFIWKEYEPEGISFPSPKFYFWDNYFWIFQSETKKSNG